MGAESAYECLNYDMSKNYRLYRGRLWEYISE